VTCSTTFFSRGSEVSNVEIVSLSFVCFANRTVNSTLSSPFLRLSLAYIPVPILFLTLRQMV